MSLKVKNPLIIHAGEKPFPCSFWDKIFAYHATAKKHELIHTGEQSHACSVCEKKNQAIEHFKKT